MIKSLLKNNEIKDEENFDFTKIKNEVKKRKKLTFVSRIRILSFDGHTWL